MFYQYEVHAPDVSSHELLIRFLSKELRVKGGSLLNGVHATNQSQLKHVKLFHAKSSALDTRLAK